MTVRLIHLPVLLGIGSTLVFASIAALLWAGEATVAAAMMVLLAADVLVLTAWGTWRILDALEGIASV